MFGFGRRSEMKDIEKRTNSSIRTIEDNLRRIKNNLNQTIQISKESELPENNILNQKELIFLDIDRVKIFFEKIRASIKIEGLDIANEIAIDNLEVGISECEQMVYSLKNMEIPTSDNLQDYFKEYSENYKISMASAKLVAGVGVLATGGAALGTGLTLTGLTTAGIVGSSLIGAGSLLGGIAAIASGPVGWIIGGIGLLSFLGSAPSKEEVAEAREELNKVLKKSGEIYDIYIETSKTLAKAEGVISLSKNFTEIRKSLSCIFNNKVVVMEKIVNDNLRENKATLEIELKEYLGDSVNRLQTHLYEMCKNKKKFFCFRRKKTIWNLIENANSAEESLKYMDKYLRLPKIYKKTLKNLSQIMRENDFSEIEISPIFEKNNTYNSLDKYLDAYLNELLLKNLKVTSPEAKREIKEVIDFVKLFKNIIITPMINIEATELNVPSEVISIIEMNKKEIAKSAMEEVLKSKEYEFILELSDIMKNEKNNEQMVVELQKKYPEINININDIEESINTIGRKIRAIFLNIEKLNLSEEEREEVGIKKIEKQMEMFGYENI